MIGIQNMDKHPLRIALETLDAALLENSLSEDVVFWTPLLTSTVSGRDFVKRVLLTAGAGLGPFQITGEFIDEGGRRMLAWDGAIDGHRVQTALTIVDGPDGKVRELRGFLRPFPVVKLMYDYMYSHFSEEIPAPYWVLQEKPA